MFTRSRQWWHIEKVWQYSIKMSVFRITYSNVCERWYQLILRNSNKNTQNNPISMFFLPNNLDKDCHRSPSDPLPARHTAMQWNWTQLRNCSCPGSMRNWNQPVDQCVLCFICSWWLKTPTTGSGSGWILSQKPVVFVSSAGNFDGVLNRSKYASMI